MGGDERAAAERLRDFWDGVVRAEPAHPAGLDPEDAAVIETLQTLYRPLSPSLSFRNALKEDLMHGSLSVPPAGMAALPFDPLRINPNGVIVPSGRHVVRIATSQASRSRWRNFLSMAAVLALLVSGALLATMAMRTGQSDGQLAILPAPLAPSDISFAFADEITGGNDPLERPSGIAVGADGTVYVIDADRDQIRVFAADGTPVATWGESGTAPGQFEFGIGVWADLAIGPNGNLFVLDPNLSRVQEFTPDGDFVRGWGELGSEPGQFSAPTGIGIDDAGQVYVADYANHRVQVFDAEGRFVAAWDGTNGGGELAGPQDVAIAADGTVWVTDDILQRIIGFRPDGTAFTSMGKAGGQPGEVRGPGGIAIDAAGDLAVAEYTGNRVQRFAADGSSLEVLGERGDGPGQFANPIYLAFAPDGSLYISDEGNHRVQKFTPGAGPQATPDA